MTAEELATLALTARENAHAPYSRFAVGAALEDDTGRVHTGCNIENATFGLTICAERVAVFKAVSGGVRKFRRIAIAAGTGELIVPCGACRQILHEFCGDIEILLCNPQGKRESLRLSQIFPRPFHDEFFR
jgi:cytidine deaminase